jgi:hypothetical protein
MEPEGSLPCSQDPSTGSCMEPDQFSRPFSTITARHGVLKFFKNTIVCGSGIQPGVREDILGGT